LVLAALANAGRVPHIFDALAAVQLHLAGLAALIAVAAGLARRGRSAALAAAACALALVGAEELRRTPERASAAGDAATVTLIAANVFRFNADPAALAEALAALDADVLVTVETPEALLAEPGPLAEAFPHDRRWREPAGRGHVALWSRRPFAPSPADRIGGHPAHVIATLDLGEGARFTVMGVHFDWPVVGAQNWQLLDFNRFWGLLPRPFAVAGDFNAAPWSATVDRVEKILNAEVIGGVRPTYFGGVGGRGGKLPVPFGLPIDHVLVSPGIGVERIETLRLPGTDHRAVRTVLKVPRP
ncbi:MAG: endonuclease/exonuclease/phosphatase family protein, partial [Pseudomonadota bacterium]